MSYSNRQATLSVTTNLGSITWAMEGVGGIILANGGPTGDEEFPIDASGPMGIDEETSIG